MKHHVRLTIQSVALGLLLGAWIASAPAQGDAKPKRGPYLAKAAGCLVCDTEYKKDAVPFAGGRALKTPFGTFYGSNITPHPQAGIGRWSEADFIRAIREGVSPDGAHYFPAFPYPSYYEDLRSRFARPLGLPAFPSARQPGQSRA